MKSWLILPLNTSSLLWARSIIARPGKINYLGLSKYSPKQYNWNHQREIRLSTIPSIPLQLARKRFPMTSSTNTIRLKPIRLFTTSQNTWMHIIIFRISSVNFTFPFATLGSWQRDSWNRRWCKRSRNRSWRGSGRREWDLWAFTGYLSFNLLFCTEFLLFGFVMSDVWGCEMPEWQTLIELLYIQAPSSERDNRKWLRLTEWCRRAKRGGINAGSRGIQRLQTINTHQFCQRTSPH